MRVIIPVPPFRLRAMSTLRLAVPALAAAIAGCTFNAGGGVVRTDETPELKKGRFESSARQEPPPPPQIESNPASPTPVKPAPATIAAHASTAAPAAPAAPVAKAAAPVAATTAATAAAPAAKPGITPCCTSLQQALATSAATAADTVTLSATTPHFDFGRGVAPFAVYTLPADARTVQVYSPMQRVGMLDGGSNRTSYADTAPLFLDANAKTLEAKQIDAGQRWWGANARAYYRDYQVPAGATRLVVATDPQTEGKIGVSLIYGSPTMPLVSSDYQEFKTNGLTFDSYHMSTYGTVVLQVNR